MSPTQRLWEREGGICWICGAPVPKDDASRDHLIPFSIDRGIMNNTRLAHRLCNSERKRLPVDIVEEVLAPLRPDTEACLTALAEANRSRIVWVSE